MGGLCFGGVYLYLLCWGIMKVFLYAKGKQDNFGGFGGLGCGVCRCGIGAGGDGAGSV